MNISTAYLIILGFLFGTGLGFQVSEYINIKRPMYDTHRHIYDIKTIPDEFILACSLMIDGETKNARIMVNVYNFLNDCKIE